MFAESLLLGRVKSGTDRKEYLAIILKEIEASGFAISPEEISEMSAQAASNANTAETSIASTLILICWLVGIADAYRASKHTDKTHGN